MIFISIATSKLRFLFLHSCLLWLWLCSSRFEQISGRNTFRRTNRIFWTIFNIKTYYFHWKLVCVVLTNWWVGLFQMATTEQTTAFRSGQTATFSFWICKLKLKCTKFFLTHYCTFISIITSTFSSSYSFWVFVSCPKKKNRVPQNKVQTHKMHPSHFSRRHFHLIWSYFINNVLL